MKRRRIGFNYNKGFWDFVTGRGIDRAINFSQDIRDDYKEFNEFDIRIDSGGTGYITIKDLSPERAEELIERTKKAFNNRVWEDEVF